MYLPDFEYYAPTSVAEACRMLSKFGARAKVLAGGTDILHKMKQGELTPEVVISINGIEQLKEISCKKGQGIVIGARATHNEIANSSVLQKRYLSICEAAHKMANNQTRNMGTVGGNIVNAVSSADLPPILIALGATIKLESMQGQRILPLEEFYTGVSASVIAPEEILTEIIVPEQAMTGSTFIRFGLRRSGALAVVSVAVAINMEGNVCREARIALGAAGPVPMRARQAEALLNNQVITDALLEEAGVVASRECNPRSSIRGSEEYRRDLIKVLTRRALHKAINEGHV